MKDGMKTPITTTLLAVSLCLTTLGCGGDPSRHTTRAAVNAYYAHDYPSARDKLRAPAHNRESNDIVLNNMRLGLAALADGDEDEAERALLRAYEYLTTGKVNDDGRTAASTWIYEGIKVWKGEPFEQAMSFYHIAALYMIKGEWDNARAAAQNALFSLRDFKGAAKGPHDMQSIVDQAIKHEKLGQGDYFKKGYDIIASEFALGYLIAATNAQLLNNPNESKRLFSYVRKLDPALAPLIDRLQGGNWDTLLLVDMGTGPRRVAYGEDNALSKFIPNGLNHDTPLIHIAVDGKPQPDESQPAAVDLWRLSQYPKWWSLESMRKSKSLVGNIMLAGGAGTLAYGARKNNDTATAIGIGLILAGAALKASSHADTRHLEVLPRCTYLVPINLGKADRDITITFDGNTGSNATWHDLSGGSPGRPKVYYLRMHDGRGRGMPPWSRKHIYSVIPNQYRKGDIPWIMGGKDLTPPNPTLVSAYKRSGGQSANLADQLSTLYQAEGALERPGPQGRSGPSAFEPALYRHIAEGGRVLYTPKPGTHLYQRLTRLEHPPYLPQSPILIKHLQQIQTNNDNKPLHSKGAVQ